MVEGSGQDNLRLRTLAQRKRLNWEIIVLARGPVFCSPIYVIDFW
jgi:hypothetical protein